MSISSLLQMREHLDIFHCPQCHGPLTVNGEPRCEACGRNFPLENGIPRLYVPTDPNSSQEQLTAEVRAFYEETPFPNYQDMESIEDLITKAEKGLFARLLNDQLPFNGRVLEAGCGTGQLSNFLGVAQRQMFAVDMTLNSLQLANDFRTRHALNNVGFYQMNLYRPIFKPESFDVVLCNGVVCATVDPYGAFKSVAPLTKRGGYLLIGTYNTVGRLITDARRALIRVFGEKAMFLDPHLRNQNLSAAKKKAWLQDQYRHPYETKQSFGEVISWFERHDFEFVYGIPHPRAFVPFKESDQLFGEPDSRGNWLDHAIVQTKLMFEGSFEGGFFLMIGRRK